VSKPLTTDDFRAVRIVLEPEDFALTDGKPDVPDDPIDRETWNGIMVLPDDVAIRTSNHKGEWLKELYHQQTLWTEYAVGDSDNSDILFEAMLYTMDELDAALFLNLHGFYRQSIGCLRNTLEIVTVGTYLHIYNLSDDLKLWNDGKKKIPFGAACDHLNNARPVRKLQAHLRAELKDSLFETVNKAPKAGWVRRLYDTLCSYAHSQPDMTNVNMWKSNGPIYVPGAFHQAMNLFIDTIMTGYLLVKLARPSSGLPDDTKAWFESFKEDEEDRTMYEVYRYLFRNAPQGNS